MSYQTIHNNGNIFEEGRMLTNQCLWISIKDYLEYCRNMKMSVIDIKAIGGLSAESDYEMFDWENETYRRAINRIADVLNIRINFFLVDAHGKHHPELYLEGRPIPMHMINDEKPGTDIVNIAFYGAHFEFIIKGLNIRECRKQSDIKSDIGVFQPHVNVAGEFVPIDESDEFVHIHALIVANLNKIDINKKFIQESYDKQHDYIEYIRNTFAMPDLTDKEKNQLSDNYKREYTELIDIALKKQEENTKLIDENEHLSYALSLANEKHNDKNVLVFCHPKKINIKDKDSHWWLNTPYPSISSKPIMQYIFTRNNIPFENIIKTVDINGSPDYKENGFDPMFINKHKNEFDIVMLPDCGGRWWGLTHIKDMGEQTIMLQLLVDDLMNLVKTKGALYLSKLIFPDKVLTDVEKNLFGQYKVTRWGSELIEITKG